MLLELFRSHFFLQVLIFALVCFVYAAPQEQYQEPVPILRQDQEVNFDGSYKFRYANYEN